MDEKSIPYLDASSTSGYCLAVTRDRWIAVIGIVSLSLLTYLSVQRSSGNHVPNTPNELGKYLVLQTKSENLDEIQSSIQSIQDKFHLQLITGEVESLPWTMELPAGTLPIVVQIGKPKGQSRPIMKRTRELNFPTYHVDSDPLMEHVVPFPSLDADEYLGNFGKWASEYFVSDGNTNTFSFP